MSTSPTDRKAPEPAAADAVPDYSALAESLADETDRDMTKVERGADPEPGQRAEFSPAAAAAVARAVAKHPGIQEIVRQLATDAGLDPNALKLLVQATLRPKATKGGQKVYREIVRQMLTPAGATGTQDAIRKAVQKLHPHIPVSKGWRVPLKPWAVKQVRKWVGMADPPFHTLSIADKTTLGQIHSDAKALLLGGQVGAAAFRADILLTPDSVIVNGTPFKIGDNKAGKGKSYRYLKVNVDKLRDALEHHPRRARATAGPAAASTPQPTTDPKDHDEE